MRKTLVFSSILALAAAQGALAQDQSQQQYGSSQQTAQEQQSQQQENQAKETLSYDYAADKLIGRNVQSTEGQDIGKVKDLIVSGGQISHAILGVGGFLGIGDRQVAVPFDQLQVSQDQVIYSGTQDELAGMPQFMYKEEAQQQAQQQQQEQQEQQQAQVEEAQQDQGEQQAQAPQDQPRTSE